MVNLTIEQIPTTPGVPHGWVQIAIYGGTSRFPLAQFTVTEIWWNDCVDNCEIIFRTFKPDIEVLPPLAKEPS